MRQQRQQAIARILARRAVRTQGELRRALRRAGLAVDQSTLSRDLAELGARKTGGRYALAPAGNGAPRPAVDYGALVRSFCACGPHLVVLRTAIGQAQPVALAIDARQDAAIVATLAGDDTIFLATRTRKTQAVALRRLESWFGDKRER
jgi:transcriptional regulator of arginine metabolism